MTEISEGLEAWADGLFVEGSVRLRQFRESDTEKLSGWWRDPSVTIMQTDRMPVGDDATLTEMFRMWNKNDTPSACGYSLTNHEGEFVGHVSLWGVTPPTMIATLAVIVGPEHQGNGHGRDAVRAALRIAFEEMGVNKVELQVWHFNTRARGLYASLGFVEEGVRRAAVYHRSAFHDQVLMGMLRDEYLARATRR